MGKGKERLILSEQEHWDGINAFIREEYLGKEFLPASTVTQERVDGPREAYIKRTGGKVPKGKTPEQARRELGW